MEIIDTESDDEARKERATQQLVQLAMKFPSLARAASEGYEVCNATLAEVADRIAKIDLPGEAIEGVVLVEGTRTWNQCSWEERIAPLPYAFDVLDRVKRHVKQIEATLPTCIEVEVERIARFNDDKDARFTAVIVRVVTAYWPTRAIVFKAEQ